MKYLTISNNAGVFSYQYQTDFGHFSSEESFPAEMLPHVEALAAFIDGLKKPPRELFFEKVMSLATPEEKLELISLYPERIIGRAYKVGEEFRSGDFLYKVIQAHTAQADWLPESTPALYLKIEPEGVIPEWTQPTGAHDAYQKGDQVLFEGAVYESVIDANTWSPTVSPACWKLVP